MGRLDLLDSAFRGIDVPTSQALRSSRWETFVLITLSLPLSSTLLDGTSGVQILDLSRVYTLSRLLALLLVQVLSSLISLL